MCVGVVAHLDDVFGVVAPSASQDDVPPSPLLSSHLISSHLLIIKKKYIFISIYLVLSKKRRENARMYPLSRSPQITRP